MAKAEKPAVRRLREHEDVEKALEQSAPGELERKSFGRRPRTWLWVEGGLVLLLGAFAYLAHKDLVNPAGLLLRDRS